jgi:hypothetical protein
MQAVLHRRQALCHIFHEGPLSVDFPSIMGGCRDLFIVWGNEWSAVADPATLMIDKECRDL